jgi:hypothetical protein
MTSFKSRDVRKRVPEGFEDDPEADLNMTDLENEPIELEASMEDEPEEFQSRPATDLTDPRTNRVPVVREEIIPSTVLRCRRSDPSPYKRDTIIVLECGPISTSCWLTRLITTNTF